MTNKHHNNLIVISLNQGYTEDVMQVARKAGTTGGTIIKGRLTDTEQFAELNSIQVDDEREILFILAPVETRKKNYGRCKQRIWTDISRKRYNLCRAVRKGI